ncbi:MAG: glycosyltransferase [Acidobacteria bacterium]|nr:glycosyltransferase [Acidobacteriota bacterium]
MQRIPICLLVDTVACEAGTERQVSETVARMDPARFDVHLCCLEASAQLDKLARYCRTAVFPLTRVHSLNGWSQIRRFRRYLNEHGIQIVQAFMVKTTIFGVLAVRGSSCPVVITSRLNTGYWYTPVWIRIFRYLNRYTTRVVANSEGAKKIAMAAEMLPADKVDVIYQGVDMARYARERGDPALPGQIGIPDYAKVVGMVANLRPVKDVALFLRAAKLVSEKVPESAFVIVGQGPQREELGRLAAELGIGNRVFFADGRGAVPDHLRRMCIGCLSSRSEGFSNAILEYMAAGLPVVATDVGGNGEAIAGGETGYLVRERTPEAFARPLVELLCDEDRRAAMGRRSFERCRERFEINAGIRRLEDYYRSLLDRP